MSESHKPPSVEAAADLPSAVLQIVAAHGLDLEQISAEAREAEARAEAEYAASLGDGKPPPADDYVLGRVDAALVEANPSRAALALLRDPAFLGQARKASRATVDVVCKELRPVGITRAAVEEALGTQNAPPRPSKPIGRADPEPAPEPQDTGQLLAELRHAFKAHVVVPDGAELALPLWALHTWVLEADRYTPRLALTSPTKRCGKTTVLELLDLLCARSLRTANLSPAVMYRAVEAERPTLLVDEADSFLGDNQELRGVVNAGFQKGGSVLRCVGDDHRPTTFDCYAAVAIASIGALPGTIADRAITVRMTRKASGAPIERLDRAARERLEALRPRLARWAADAMPKLEDAAPEMPERLNDRQRDICGPLVAIADRAGGHWPDAARAALVALCAASEEDAADVRERALAAVWAQYSDGAAFKALGELVNVMLADESAGWTTANRGRPLDTGTLARWIRAYGVKCRQRRVGDGDERPRGYDRADLAPIAARYLATTDAPERDAVAYRDKRRDGVTASATSDSHSGNGVTPTGTPAACHAVTPDSGGGADVRWRVEAMRSQVPAVGAIPYLVARPGAGGPGRCPSCGDPYPSGARCAPCIEAVQRVTAEAEVRRVAP